MCDKQYKDCGEIGHGGYGHVRKVQNLSNKEYYAKKSILVEKHNPPDKIYQEIEFLRKLKHKNIIEIVGDYETEVDKKKNINIIMPLANGKYLEQMIHLGNLTNFIKERGKNYLSEKEILHIINEIFQGVGHCHDNNIIHGDLKPKNILMKDSIPKICDFGSAYKDKDKDKGTPKNIGYTAPEIGDEIYSPKADIWALGCILYELSTFRPAYPGPKHRIYDKSPILDEYPDVKKLVLDILNPQYDCVQQVDNYNQRPTINTLIMRTNDLLHPGSNRDHSSSSLGDLNPDRDEENLIGSQNTPKVLNKTKKKKHYYLWVGFFICIFIILPGIGIMKFYKTKKIEELKNKINENRYTDENKLSSMNENRFIHELEYLLNKKMNILANKITNFNENIETAGFGLKHKIDMKGEKLLIDNRECQSENKKLYLIGNVIKEINKTNNYSASQSIAKPYKCETRGTNNLHDIYLCAEETSYINTIEEFSTQIIDLRGNMNKPAIKLFATSGERSQCYFINDLEIICTSYTGYIYKYVINHKLDHFTYSKFAHINDGKLKSSYAMQTANGIIIIGGESLHIFDQSAYLITKKSFEIGVNDFSELAPGIIMVVGNLELNVLNITNIYMEGHPISYNTITNFHPLYSHKIVIPLTHGEGMYFATSGIVNNNGFVLIGELLRDLTAITHGEKTNLPEGECNIIFIRELEAGIIWFGGKKCTQVCSWKYMQENDPICYPLGRSIDIVTACPQIWQNKTLVIP